MRHLLGVTFIASALALSACGGAPADIRAKIKIFQDRANAGRLDEIRREHTPMISDFDKYMSKRSELGRMIRTSEARSQTGSGYSTQVTVHHNTDFERGHVLEVFAFLIEDAGPKLLTYSYHIDKKMWCPTLSFLASTQCSIEDAPKGS